MNKKKNSKDSIRERMFHEMRNKDIFNLAKDYVSKLLIMH